MQILHGPVTFLKLFVIHDFLRCWYGKWFPQLADLQRALGRSLVWPERLGVRVLSGRIEKCDGLQHSPQSLSIRNFCQIRLHQ